MRPETRPADTPDLVLRLESRPENVSLVREAIAAVGETARIDRGTLDDIQTAVTEACNNVVRHAYGERVGPLEVDLELDREAVEVAVRDRGGGIRAPIGHGRDHQVSLGIGMLVIQSLTAHVDFLQPAPSGVEVRIRFAAPSVEALDGQRREVGPPPRPDASDAERAVGVAIGPPRLAKAILPRLMTALAARAHFSSDRISDLQLLGDALALHAPGALANGSLNARIAASQRTMQVEIGPLQPAGSRRIVHDSAVDGAGALIERLADRLRVRPSPRGETLSLRIDDPAAGR